MNDQQTIDALDELFTNQIDNEIQQPSEQIKLNFRVCDEKEATRILWAIGYPGINRPPQQNAFWIKISTSLDAVYQIASWDHQTKEFNDRLKVFGFALLKNYDADELIVLGLVRTIFLDDGNNGTN